MDLTQRLCKCHVMQVLIRFWWHVSQNSQSSFSTLWTCWVLRHAVLNQGTLIDRTHDENRLGRQCGEEAMVLISAALRARSLASTTCAWHYAYPRPRHPSFSKNRRKKRNIFYKLHNIRLVTYQGLHCSENWSAYRTGTRKQRVSKWIAIAI